MSDEIEAQTAGCWSAELAAKGLHTQKAPHDLAGKFPDLAAKSLVTVRLHPRQGELDDTSASKLAGKFLWPSDEEWPTCQLHKEVLVTVLQLRADEFPELKLPAGKDLLQLLWCPLDHAELGHCPEPRIFLRSTKDIEKALESMPKPEEFEPDYYPTPCLLHAERVTEYPSPQEMAPGKVEEIEKWIESSLGEEEWLEEGVYQDLLSTAPGTKIGGYVNWIEELVQPVCSCGKKMEHLLTVASSEFDASNYRRWCSEEELAVWTDSRLQQAAELMLGETGAMYLFVCRSCDPWSIKPIHQSN